MMWPPNETTHIFVCIWVQKSPIRNFTMVPYYPVLCNEEIGAGVYGRQHTTPLSNERKLATTDFHSGEKLPPIAIHSVSRCSPEFLKVTFLVYIYFYQVRYAASEHCHFYSHKYFDGWTANWYFWSSLMVHKTLVLKRNTFQLQTSARKAVLVMPPFAK